MKTIKWGLSILCVLLALFGGMIAGAVLAAKSNGLPTPEYIPIDESSKTESVTETGIIGLMSHKKLFGRLIVMSLEWIGEILALT